MKPSFVDPHNHVPEVSPDDGWDNAEGCEGEAKPAATVLPPRRNQKDRPQATPAPAEAGLRIGTSQPRATTAESGTRLEVQEITSGIIRLEQEVPPPPKVERQVSFKERPSREDVARQRDHTREWGTNRVHAHRWLIGSGAAVAAIVVVSLILLPSLDSPGKQREKMAYQPVLTEEKDEKLALLNEMLGKQPEAIQLFRAFSHAAHLDDIVPMVRKGSAIREVLQSHWKPLNPPKQWAPSIESKWSVFDEEGSLYGLLEDSLPDGTPFAAYVAFEEGRLLLDWKATTAYSTATFEELEKGEGDFSEIRGSVSPAEYYSTIYPEQEYQCYRFVSPDKVTLIWCYARRGTMEEALIGKHFQSGDILKETRTPKKMTLRLETAPEGAMANQWTVGEMLHIDWLTP